MARQYLIPGYGYINAAEDGREYLLPGAGYFNDATVSAGQTVAVAQVTETDLAQAISWAPKIRILGQVSETDLAQAITRVKTLALGQVSETDLAQAITSLKTKVLGQTTETDLAQTITRSGISVAVGQVSETDLAQSVAWAPKARLVGQTSETDLAQSIARVKARGLTQVTETDLAQALTVRKARTLGQALETDLAQDIAVSGGGVTVVESVTPGWEIPGFRAGRVPTREEREAAVLAQRQAFGVVPRPVARKAEPELEPEPTSGAVAEPGAEVVDLAARRANQRAMLLLLMAA